MTPRALPVAASVAYAANCALGLAVAARLIDTHEIRWVHHALFTVTTALTGASAAAAIGAGRPKPALAFAAALGVLGTIPFVGTRTWRHSATAVAAAPFFAAALITSRTTSRG